MIGIRHACMLVLAALVALSGTALAGDQNSEPSAEQKAMLETYRQAATPGPQHALLASSTGTWDMQIRSWHEPGKPPTIEHGTAERHMALDGRVLVEEVHSTMMGQAFTGIGMSGYDNVSGKHWSTWNDSMSTGLMVSEGECDAKGACTFHGSWNDPMTKAKVTARMTSRWTADDTQVFEMYGPGDDGKEVKMMEITYTRSDS